MCRSLTRCTQSKVEEDRTVGDAWAHHQVGQDELSRHHDVREADRVAREVGPRGQHLLQHRRSSQEGGLGGARREFVGNFAGKTKDGIDPVHYSVVQVLCAKAQGALKTAGFSLY